MEDLTLKAVWNQPMTGNMQWSWSVRQGVQNTEAFMQGVRTNTDTLTIPAANLAGVDLKRITIAVKCKIG